MHLTKYGQLSKVYYPKNNKNLKNSTFWCNVNCICSYCESQKHIFLLADHHGDIII